MPQIDVSFVLADPMFQDSFTVIRRSSEVGADGRAVATETQHPTKGVVTNQDPAELMRRDDGQFVPKAIFVASRFSFRQVSAETLPDIIVWAGVRYEVKQLYPYSRFGRGFNEVVARSLDAIDQPQ